LKFNLYYLNMEPVERSLCVLNACLESHSFLNAKSSSVENNKNVVTAKKEDLNTFLNQPFDKREPYF